MATEPKIKVKLSKAGVALNYAQRIATAMWKKNWQDDSPDFKPFDDIMGVLSQIDNMAAGMTRPGEREPDEIWSVWETKKPQLFHVVIRSLGTLNIIAENLNKETAEQICADHNGRHFHNDPSSATAGAETHK